MTKTLAFLHIILWAVYIPCNGKEEIIVMDSSWPNMTEMKSDLFDQVIQTSIEEEILAQMPDKEVKSHLRRGERSKRVLRSIQNTVCGNALDDSTCKYLRLNGECQLKPNEMKLYCPDTCGFCDGVPRRCLLSQFGCCADGITVAKGRNLEGCPEKCEDKKKTKFCKIVKRLSMCFDKGMLSKCSKTCGVCRPCKDDNKFKCYYAAKYGSCKTHTNMMMNDCRKSCNMCGAQDKCHNHPCPRHATCIVNSEGKPNCRCRKKCHKGDHHTGPICARNGVTYNNLCELKRTVCHRYHYVTVKHYGKCSSKVRAHRSLQCTRVKRDPADCKLWKTKGFCKSKADQMMNMCPHTCNFCANSYPQPSCHYTKYGCCLDNITECKGEGYQGCPNKKKTCRDQYHVLCRRFVALCGHTKHAPFLKLHCPKTCLFC